MSNHDLPVGRRRDDQTDLVQPASISSAPPWDSVLDRLTNLERSHADLARLVTSIHQALPPEIAAATGRGLALGSPIDAVSPTTSFGVASPILGTPPPPLPERIEPPGSPNIDPFAQTFEAPDPWAAPVVGGEAFFQPLESPGMALAQAPIRPRRRMLRGRRAAKEAQARIAAEFAAPPPPPGFYAHDPGALAPPPPPPGFGPDGPAPDFGLPTGWGTLDAPPPTPAGFATHEMWSAPHPPPGYATDSPNAGFAAPPGWFGSAAEGPPPPPIGFASDLAEPAVVEAPEPAPSSWGAGDLSSPSDFVFDQPAVPPPPGFGPSGSEGLSDAPPPPPPGFGGGFAVDAPPPPPPGFAQPPDQAMPAPPPGFASGSPMHASSDEVFGAAQDVASLVVPQAIEPRPMAEEEARFIAGTGTDRTSYASVPPITPDFFARAAGKGRR